MLCFSRKPPQVFSRPSLSDNVLASVQISWSFSKVRVVWLVMIFSLRQKVGTLKLKRVWLKQRQLYVVFNVAERAVTQRNLYVQQHVLKFAPSEGAISDSFNKADHSFKLSPPPPQSSAEVKLPLDVHPAEVVVYSFILRHVSQPLSWVTELQLLRNICSPFLPVFHVTWRWTQAKQSSHESQCSDFYTNTRLQKSFLVFCHSPCIKPSTDQDFPQLVLNEVVEVSQIHEGEFPSTCVKSF